MTPSRPAAPSFPLWKTLVFSLTPLVVSLCAAELTVRFLGIQDRCHGGYETSPLWSCDPILGFKLKEGLTPLGRPLNRAGFRTHEFTRKRPGVYRVLALGDSTTFGIVTAGFFQYIAEPYPERLEHMLDDRIGRGKVEVLNAGVAGYNSFHGVLLLRGKLRGLRPDLITVRYGWNDHLMSKNGGDVYREIESPLLRAGEDLLLRTALYPFLRGLGRTFATRAATEHTPTAADIPRRWNPDVPLERYRQNLRRIVALGRREGAEVWLMTAPHAFLIDENRGQYDKFPDNMSALGLIRFNAIPDFGRLIEIHDAYAQATREVAGEVGAPLIDVEALYASHAAEHLYTSTDVVHPTQEGHDLEAEALYARMVDAGIVRPAATATLVRRP